MGSFFLETKNHLVDHLTITLQCQEPFFFFFYLPSFGPTVFILPVNRVFCTPCTHCISHRLAPTAPGLPSVFELLVTGAGHVVGRGVVVGKDGEEAGGGRALLTVILS